MTIQDLQGKKIGIIGFGIEGKAVASFLDAYGLKYEVYDKKDSENYLKNISAMDVIFRSPGVKMDLPELIEAKNRGAQITSQIKIFFDNCKGKIIGVTGTKGKSTTAKLIHDILSHAGIKNYFGGNYGEPVLDLLEKIEKDDWVVLELSSFQLQDLEKSPHIAAVLMVTSEHLNYHADESEYVRAKEAITKFQTKTDFAVINYDYENSMAIGKLGKAAKEYVQTVATAMPSDPFKVFKPEQYVKIKNGFFAEKIHGQAYLVENGELKEFMPLADIPLRGFHNAQNVGAAVLCAKTAGASNFQIIEAIREFKVPPHRVEFVGEKNGIKYYDDSISTTPESCLASVESFIEPVVLILGGDDKKADYTKLARELSELRQLKAVVCVGDIQNVLKEGLQEADFKGQLFCGAINMKEIVEQARSVAKSGDVVLLAPGTSSFGMFKDYKDRGDQFKGLVK